MTDSVSSLCKLSIPETGLASKSMTTSPSSRPARLAGRDLSGQIDRLAVLDDALLVLDYKTNRPPPSTPDEVAPAYVAQLAAYRLALRRVFPERALRAAIVWTDGPKLMEIPSNLLDRAERLIVEEAPSLDVPEVRT